MPFKFKLSRRLAASHSLLLTAALVAAGCNANKAVESAYIPIIAQLLILPQAVILEPFDAQEYTALGITSDGDTTGVVVTWSATGGTIAPDGMFTAGEDHGAFEVIATSAGSDPVTGKSRVEVLVPLSQLMISPSEVTLAPDSTQQFSVYGWRQGDSVAVSVTYTATTGTIDHYGLYRAGGATGTYSVIATHTEETKNRTHVRAAAAALHIYPPPSLSQIILTPPSAQLRPGDTQQFQAYGRLSNGDSVATDVVYTATGGIINEDGLYTAGHQNFRPS